MPAIPSAQELRESITIKNAGAPYSVNGAGTQGTTFTTAWARIWEQGGGKENTDQKHQVSNQTFEVWMRYIEGVTAFMEIVWGSRTLLITAPPQKITDGNNRRWWVIQAEEIVERSV